MFVYSFCFFLSFSKQGWASVQTPNGSGGGATAPNPTRKLEAHFFWVGVASAAYPQLRRLRTCFIIFVKSQMRNIFWGGVASAAYPLLRKPSLMFYRFISKLQKRGRALSQTPSGSPVFRPLGTRRGQEGVKEKKGGGAAAPNPGKDGQFFVFFL